MTQIKNICLLGFAKQAEQIIKSQLTQRCSENNLVWVSANAKILDGIIINSMFLDTPQIKKYLATVKVPSVSIYTQESGYEIANRYKIPALKLEDKIAFNDHWLDTLLNRQKKSTVPEESTAAVTQSFQDYRQLIDCIKNREPVYILATSDDKKVYLSPTEQSAYINFARGNIPGIENWHWHKISNIPNPETMRRINIGQWLFETIWQSQTETFAIDHTLFYKLVRWPQPFSQNRRSEALRLAAQIKFHPVKISDLIEKTNYSKQLVEQFLFAANQAGQIETLAPTQETALENKRIDASRNDPYRETKKSFIGRLRSKLGL